MTPLAAYLLLFLAVGVGFIFVHLVAGKLFRPSKKNPEKDTIYECGEPTIGSAWIQFDLRFYVVALLFVIFDVEVAFFFPWAEVFGKANAIRKAPAPRTPEEHGAYAAKVLDLAVPSGSRESEGARQFWEQVKFLTERSKQVEEKTVQLKQVLDKVEREQNEEAKRLEAALRKMPESLQEQMRRAMSPMGPGMGPMPKQASGPELLRRELENRAVAVKEFLQGSSFGLLRKLSTEELELVNQFVVAQLMAQQMPKDLEVTRAMARRHAKELQEAAEVALEAAGPGEATVLQGVSLDQMTSLGTVRVNEAKQAAGTLAWLAFFEILVFFGVLLVGFAYLWRRGDLAWVRSMAAESKGA